MFLSFPEIDARVIRLGTIGDDFVCEYTPTTYPIQVPEIVEFKYQNSVIV